MCLDNISQLYLLSVSCHRLFFVLGHCSDVTRVLQRLKSPSTRLCNSLFMLTTPKTLSITLLREGNPPVYSRHKSLINTKIVSMPCIIKRTYEWHMLDNFPQAFNEALWIFICSLQSDTKIRYASIFYDIYSVVDQLAIGIQPMNIAETSGNLASILPT